MEDVQRKTVVEDSTTLGRRWLTMIPYYQPLRVSDCDISTGLHFCTLVPGHHRVCLSAAMRTSSVTKKSALAGTGGRYDGTTP